VIGEVVRLADPDTLQQQFAQFSPSAESLVAVSSPVTENAK